MARNPEQRNRDRLEADAINGQAIRMALQMHGATAYRAAGIVRDALDLDSHATWYKLQRGPIHYHDIQRLAAYLHVAPGWLVDWIEHAAAVLRGEESTPPDALPGVEEYTAAG